MNRHNPETITVEPPPDGSYWSVQGDLGEVLYSDESFIRCEGVQRYLRVHPPERFNLLEP